MKYYLHAGGISVESVIQILDFVQNNDGDLTIGLNSGGGQTSVAAFLLDCLNANSERVTLTALTGIYSAAFWLFYNFKGKRKIASGCRGMFHYATQPVTLCATGRPDGFEDEAIVSALKHDKIANEKIALEFMNPTELKKFKKNWDVFFGLDRMMEIFPDAQII